MNEATASLRINRLLEEAGWCFSPEGDKPANVLLEQHVSIEAGNRGLIRRFEKKIQGTIARVWGEDEPAGAGKELALNLSSEGLIVFSYRVNGFGIKPDQVQYLQLKQCLELIAQYQQVSVTCSFAFQVTRVMGQVVSSIHDLFDKRVPFFAIAEKMFKGLDRSPDSLP